MDEQTDGNAAMWAIVEIMGHQTYAGRVSEEVIAGTAFVRIDIPETSDSGAFTKFFGGGSIYAITPTTEPIAKAMAERYDRRPISLYDLPKEWQQKIRHLDHDDEEDDDIDPEWE